VTALGLLDVGAMVATHGIVGLRPTPEQVARVSAPPYDVIKPGTPLEARLAAEPASLFHITLGANPRSALDRLLAEGFLVRDDEPAFYVYEQRWGHPESGVETRTGVFIAGEVTPYDARQIIRHEKTFDDKVKGRVALRKATGHSFGPVFLLTNAALGPVLEDAKRTDPVYELTSDFGGHTDLHGIASRVFRIPEASDLGRRIQATLAPHPLYIADGHHRYHAALLHGDARFLGYVTTEARILAYDRVVRGRTAFAAVASQFDRTPSEDLTTPPKHCFRIYTKDGCWTVPFRSVPEDVVGRLDCSILERELYPALGLGHEDIADPRHFDYYPESAMDEMKSVVDRGDYDAAIALHPVSKEELFAVADAGLEDASIVMPEKSTFFSPKILSGIIALRP
jgi:uncharacterized protein (DUF1015 family)